MALVAGVNIPDNKRVDISLQTVYGVGPAVAKRVVEEAALPGNPRVRELSEEELNRLRGALGDLAAAGRTLGQVALGAFLRAGLAARRSALDLPALGAEPAPGLVALFPTVGAWTAT